MLVLSSILISTFLVMSIAFGGYSIMSEKNSGQIMQLMCSEKMQKINEKLLNIEQSVHTIFHFAEEEIKSSENLWEDEEAFEQHLDKMRELMENVAKYTDGAITVYYRLNPELLGAQEGIWLVMDGTGRFCDHEITDISLYDKDDLEHVGWYYIPIDNGSATWLNPYYNENMGVEIISYVIPIYKGSDVIGVVGMDITTDLLYQYVKSVKMYNTGYAFLMDSQGYFVYHPEFEHQTALITVSEELAYLYEKSVLSHMNESVENYRWNNVDKRLTTRKLCNGMLFAVCVPYKEIVEPQQQMLSYSIVIVLLCISIFVFITIKMAKVIVQLAYKDALTGLGNKTGYKECIEMLDKKIASKEAIEFAIIVVDINNLKIINDRYGHEYGDSLIQSGAAILKTVWGSNVSYRIGGDEFVVISLNTTREKVGEKVLQFESEIEKYRNKSNKNEICLQMAIGIAFYESGKDCTCADVFRRADIAMYEDKKRKKEQERQ